MRNSLIHLLILVKTFLQAVYIIDPPIDNSRISIRCYESGENEGNIHSNFTLKMWRSLRRGGSYLIDETIPSRFIDGRQPSFNSPIIDCGNQTINKIIINKGNIEIFHSPIRCKQLTIIRFIFLDEWNQPFIENIIRKDLVDLRQLNYRYIMLCQENYSKPINIRILDKSKSDVLKVTDNFTTTKTNLSDKGIIEMIRKSYGDDGYELNESNSFITILRKFYRNNKKKLIIEYGGKLKLYEIRNDKLEKSIIEKNENLLKHIQENLQNVNNSISRNLSEIKYYTNPPSSWRTGQ
ncbi:hypothetical protein SNEBB_006502 [Seison nebaliae]|nr:hypothetical protein SNEBB_006502 [Seison nebaliae]